MILFLDCASGISGDMLTAALLELADDGREGVALAALVRPALAAVGLDPGLVESATVRRGGVAARAFAVTDTPGFATFAELIAAVEAAALAPAVTHAVVSVAQRMAAAEARVHGTADEHLHELSGVDTVVDLLATAALLAHLAPERVLASPPALGSGLVRTAHGVVSVPAPAVLELLRGWPTAGGQLDAGEPLGELTTPTGAALLVQHARPCPALPAGRIERTGFGAGQRELPGRPNVLRAVLLTPATQCCADDEALVWPLAGAPEHVLLETNIDDMSPELLAHAAKLLLGAGARDVWLSDALMKKGRPGVVLHVLVAATDAPRLARLVFSETSSFGVRVLPVGRLHADERRVLVTVFGWEVGVRLAFVAGQIVTVSPEYEDVRRAAGASGRPAKAVYEAAQAAARAAVGDA